MISWVEGNAVLQSRSLPFFNRAGIWRQLRLHPKRLYKKLENYLELNRTSNRTLFKSFFPFAIFDKSRQHNYHISMLEGLSFESWNKLKNNNNLNATFSAIWVGANQKRTCTATSGGQFCICNLYRYFYIKQHNTRDGIVIWVWVRLPDHENTGTVPVLVLFNVINIYISSDNGNRSWLTCQ